MSPWTVGVEEEVLLLDPLTGSVANRIDEALEALPPSVARHASAETHACVVELRTDPHRTVGEAAAELSQLRASLDDALQETLGLRAAVAAAIYRRLRCLHTGRSHPRAGRTRPTPMPARTSSDCSTCS